MSEQVNRPLVYRIEQFDADLGWRELELHQLAEVDWTRALAVRAIPAYEGQWNLSGREYCVTTDTLVDVESRLEADNLTLLDFDPTIVWIVAQPLRLRRVDDHSWSHVPDFVCVRAGDAPVVVDVARREEQGDEDRVRAAEASLEAFGMAGWEYRLLGEVDPIVLRNLRLLRRYRRPPSDLANYRELLLTACRQPRTFKELRRLDANPIAVLPALYHLLWRHELKADLRKRWSLSTLVRRGRRG